MGVLEETKVGTAEYAPDVWVYLNVNDLLMLGACYCDGGGESYFNWCVNGGQHCVGWGCAREMTKLVSWVELSLRT